MTAYQAKLELGQLRRKLESLERRRKVIDSYRDGYAPVIEREMNAQQMREVVERIELLERIVYEH